MENRIKRSKLDCLYHSAIFAACPPHYAAAVELYLVRVALLKPPCSDARLLLSPLPESLPLSRSDAGAAWQATYRFACFATQSNIIVERLMLPTSHSSVRRFNNNNNSSASAAGKYLTYCFCFVLFFFSPFLNVTAFWARSNKRRPRNSNSSVLPTATKVYILVEL